jgi:hypothetical protein
MVRYEIRSHRSVGHQDVGALQRAFERLLEGWPAIRAVDVFRAGDSLGVRFDIEGSERNAAHAAEEAFKAAWYDAFGTQGTVDLGRVIGDAGDDHEA